MDLQEHKIIMENAALDTTEAASNHIKQKINGMKLELDSLIIEYENQFDRSNKLDNKVYITLTFCGFFFVFITGLLSGISAVSRPAIMPGKILFTAYIAACIAVLVFYVYVLIYFMALLRPEQIVRLDPCKMECEHLENLTESEAYRRMISLYRGIINENLEKLKLRCDRFTRGLRCIVSMVILAFAAYALQILLQQMENVFFVTVHGLA